MAMYYVSVNGLVLEGLKQLTLFAYFNIMLFYIWRQFGQLRCHFGHLGEIVGELYFFSRFSDVFENAHYL